MAAGRAGGFGLVIGVDRSGTERERLLERGADVVIGELADVTVRAIDRRMSQLPDALLSFGLLAGVVSARRPVLFFDFDGTLSQIVDDPAAATLVPGADKALQSLAALYPVAILSGRDLADIHSRVGIPGLWYAGSHGFEMIGPDGRHHENETAAAAVPVLERAAAELTEALDIPGVMVEHKRFAVAVHYRNAAPEAARGCRRRCTRSARAVACGSHRAGWWSNSARTWTGTRARPWNGSSTRSPGRSRCCRSTSATT